MESSHQNVKQVALKLQEKGLLKLEKDKKDARVTRLSLTDQSEPFWEKTQPKGAEFMEQVFKDIDVKDLEKTREIMRKVILNLSGMDSTGEEPDEK